MAVSPRMCLALTQSGSHTKGMRIHNPASASTTLTITKARSCRDPDNPIESCELWNLGHPSLAKWQRRPQARFTFLDGATSIGSGTVSGGIATFTTDQPRGRNRTTSRPATVETQTTPLQYPRLLPEAITKASATVNMTSSFRPIHIRSGCDVYLYCDRRLGHP